MKIVEISNLEILLKILISRDILLTFFKSHDPTQLNRQGNDIGTQYRSTIMAHDEIQLEEARALVTALNLEQYNGQIKTQVEQLMIFYPAETKHEDYYALNPNSGYCQLVIKPKVEKVKKYIQESQK